MEYDLGITTNPTEPVYTFLWILSKPPVNTPTADSEQQWANARGQPLRLVLVEPFVAHLGEWPSSTKLTCMLTMSKVWVR